MASTGTARRFGRRTARRGRTGNFSGVAPLDNPVWHALEGPLAHFGVTEAGAGRLDPVFAPFAALSREPRGESWEALAGLVAPGETVVVVAAEPLEPGPDFVGGAPGVGAQMVATALRSAPDTEAVLLGPDDLDEVLALIEATQPGPFRDRTLEFGTYLGIKKAGRLVAMAGERLRVPGYTEISAVCTHPDFAGRGLAARLVRAVAAGMLERGETPMLHAARSNTRAIELYLRLGFTIRRDLWFMAATRTPGDRHPG